MKTGTSLIICCCLLLGLSSCTNTVSFSEYLSYLGNPENGMVKETKVNGLAMRMKYLPTEYFVERELNDYASNEITPILVDSLTGEYNNSLTFMFTIGPDVEAGKDFDVTRVNLENYEEYEERMDILNFQLGQQLRLNFDGNALAPSIVQMENTYGLKKETNFLVVFNLPVAKIEQQDQEMSVVYNDQVFYTGVNKFTFSTEQLRERPIINRAYRQAS
jgi:hypothetical protein